MKKTLTKQIVAGVAVLSILGGGIYIAKQDVSAANTTTSTTVTTGVVGKIKHSFGLVRQFSDEVLALLKLDKATLEEKLVNGQSLAQIAEAQGVTRDALKTQLTNQANQILEKQKTEFTTNLDAVIDSTDLGKMAGREGHGGKGGPGGFGGGHGGKDGPGADLSGLVTILGYADETALKTALQEGNTLTELATTQKVDIQLVKDEVAKQVQAHLDEELASGEITQALYDELKADITNRVDDIVNHERHARNMR